MIGEGDSIDESFGIETVIIDVISTHLSNYGSIRSYITL